MNLKKIILATTLSLLITNVNTNASTSSIQSLPKNQTTPYSKTIPYSTPDKKNKKPTTYGQKAIFRPEDIETELIEINSNEYDNESHKGNNSKKPQRRIKQPSGLSNSF